MAINADNTITDLLENIQAFHVEDDITNGLFAGRLEEQTAQIEGNKYSDEIAAIKEKGLVAYIMELHAKKLREEILASMGLTEEDLAKMPPKQRAALEKRIEEEIRKRMAAEAMMQDDKKKDNPNKLEEIVLEMNPDSLLKMGKMESTDFPVTKQENEDR